MSKHRRYTLREGLAEVFVDGNSDFNNLDYYYYCEKEKDSTHKVKINI